MGTVSRVELSLEVLAADYLAAVVPVGLDPGDDQRARREAVAFLDLLLRHLKGDVAALDEIESRLRTVAGQVVQEGDDAGVLLDRFDAGRHVILRYLLRAGAAAVEVEDVDDRLREAQSAARGAIRDAAADYEALIEGWVAEVTRGIESGAAPDEVMHVAAGALCALVDSDRARVWLDTGGGRLELVASAGSTSPMGFFVSSERGILADILNARAPTRQCPVDPREWEAAVPNLPIPASALFVPLAAVGRPFGLLYALRNEPRPFSDAGERAALRFVERVEPALAWAMQVRSMKRLTEASQDFLRITTHELRRPLTVLRGYLDMLGTMGPNEEEVLRTRMGRAAEQMAEMLTDISETITLEDPARTMRPTRVTLGELMDRAVSAAQDEAEQQNVLFVHEVEGAETELDCDVDDVLHALANLLSNAFRHTGGERHVWLSAGPEGKRLVRFLVRDEGVGISSGDEGRLFNKYYRSDETRRSGSIGSGLGLYFVRLVAERHGGRVSGENWPRGGACFTLELPLEPGLIAWSI
jgi:signal transduction histidine kinase